MVEQVEFKDFRIGELFDVSLWRYSLQSQNFLSTSPVKTSTHDLAVVTGTVTNNSIAYYVNRNEVNKSNIYSKTLTMTTRGQSGVVKFQEEEFLLHNNSLALCGVFEKLNKNKKVVLYLMTVLNKLGYGNSYSNFPTVKSLSEKTIPLPVDSSGSINYSYMESYISYIEKLHVANIEKLHVANIEKLLQELGYNSLKDVELTQEDKEILRLFSGGGEKLTLAEFKIGELFEIIPTTTTITDSLNGGDFLTPLVSNTTTNNGIKEYVSRVPNNKGNVITFSDTTTSSDTIFYQEDDFVGYSHIQKMELKEETLNKNIAMFIISVMRKQIEGKYSWGTKFNRKNAAATVVSLPINPHSPETPNYQLMESYIKAIEKLHVNKLISSHNKEIAALNTVI